MSMHSSTPHSSHRPFVGISFFHHSLIILFPSPIPPRVFHASTFEILARLQGHRDRISGVQKLSDSNHYVSAGYDGGLLVWLSAGQLMARGRDMGGRGGGGGGGGGRSPRKTTSGVG